ncbi:MAG: hypothetical protein KTR24_06950 [Saprospiraceae bacterium]|nr:hypothetical protein [Saprospiraceae bacterium]
MPIAVLLSILLGVVVPLVFVALYLTAAKKAVDRTSYISDQEIIMHLHSAAGKFTTYRELADFFGLTKSEMIHRIAALKSRYVVESYSNGISGFHQLRFPLPPGITPGYDQRLTVDRLYELFDKYDNSVTLATIVVETGLSAKAADKVLKQFTKEKLIARVGNMKGDRRYVLLQKYRREQKESTDDTLRLIDRHGGHITIPELAREQGIDEHEAQETLELLERKDLVKLTLDPEGNPAFRVKR